MHHVVVANFVEINDIVVTKFVWSTIDYVIVAIECILYEGF